MAYAAIRAGQWLHDEKTLWEGRQLLEHVTSLDLHLTGLDVVDGAAGAIPALIQLEREYPSPALRSFIVQLADQLVSKADRSARGWSWNTITGGDHPNLTGFAHGVAGIVNALLEAYAFTQNPAYQEAAFHGLRYENSFFDQQQQNWPDFRLTGIQDPANGGGYAAGPTCSCAWCHGAPGIALSRLRGYELTLHPALKAEAVTAVKTTAAHSTWDQQQNFSLCHGLSGNAEVLLEAADILALAQYQQQAAAIGQAGQERYRTTELWATGLYNAYQLPDFMLGLAGIGYFYLRLTNPHVYPSVLLLR
ncbi:lanthionine synthetase LanC family protein [Hymenobacter radiodurans]|uniref:lanthionine synthetase LanC family protein n=1 Tax=Hymenobacter radiodurans TaxID=2496028 RepID=UPI001404972B|nr:lanthionine synthetase LanC family protein [Hymenobacter radiodurans]